MADIRVAVVDDQTLICEGVTMLLEMAPGLTVAGQASNGQEAIALAESKSPDVILMDVRMPGMNGVAATRQICADHPEIRVIVLTTFDDDEYVIEALKAGACGYLLKNANADHLAAAIRAVHAGDSVLDPAVTDAVIRRATRGEGSEPNLVERLTPRQREVLSLMGEGLTNPEIAARLCLSEGTVRNHVSHILGKLGVSDRVSAVRLAVEWGLVDGLKP